MKETATAVMYDMREIIYERKSLRLDVLMIIPRGCVGPCRDPQMEEWVRKNVDSGALKHMEGPYTSCEVVGVKIFGHWRPRETGLSIITL